MGTSIQKLDLLLVLDGIQIPAIEAKVSSTESGMCIAEIGVVPTDEMYGIEPRTFVELFYYEADNAHNPSAREGTPGPAGPQDYRNWKLLFAGEFIAITKVKNASGRMGVLTAADPTNYWDAVKQYQVNFSSGGIEQFENAFAGVKLDRIKSFDVQGADMNSNLFSWLTRSKGPGGKPNLYLGIQRTLREMFFAANDFYARAFNRLRIGDQIVGIPGDATAAKLFEIQQFQKFLENRIGGGGGMMTARMMVQALMQPVFHTYVTIPAPWFDRQGRARGFVPDGAGDLDLLAEIIQRPRSWPGSSLNYTIIKPDSWFLVPPACNVLFPHQHTGFQISRNYIAEPTRLFLRTSLMGTGADALLTERFYAPDFEEINKLMFKEGGFLGRLAATVLKHEEFVGINGVEVWQEDVGAFVQKGSRREYFKYLADYLFWKSRFESRTAQVSGPFNPNLVPGYPILVMDETGPPGKLTRHYVGQVQSITHSIGQEGAVTSVSMTGCRVHDETADFDAKGRSLEEIAARGTDGFMDDRYDPLRVGKEVYQVLFGIGSIVDLSTGVDLTEQLNMFVGETTERAQVIRHLAAKIAAQSPLQRAVSTLQVLYQAVALLGGNTQAFAKSVTVRPKANLLEMNGLSYMESGFPGPQQKRYSEAVLRVQDPEQLRNEGFFATAVDPDAETTRNATFKAVSKRVIPKTVTTTLPAETVPLGDNGKEVILEPEITRTSITYQTVEASRTGSYELDSHLNARRSRVRSYAESLRDRGIRG